MAYGTMYDTMSEKSTNLPAFCDHDLEINLMTLKLKGDQDTKIYYHTENEVAVLRDSKLRP